MSILAVALLAVSAVYIGLSAISYAVNAFLPKPLKPEKSTLESEIARGDDEIEKTLEAIEQRHKEEQWTKSAQGRSSQSAAESLE